jgi:hypothetical protein
VGGIAGERVRKVGKRVGQNQLRYVGAFDSRTERKTYGMVFQGDCNTLEGHSEYKVGEDGVYA